MKYRFVKTIFNNESYYPGTVLFNMNWVVFNITPNTIVTVTIKDKNITSDSERIWIQEEISIHGQPKILNDIHVDWEYYIRRSYANKEEVNSIINFETPYYPNTLWSVEGDYIKILTNYTTFDLSQQDTILYNWHTGWLEYYETERISRTINFYLRFERITELLPKIIEFATNGIIIGLLGIGLGSIAILFTNYKKESELSLNGNKKSSFMQYLKNKPLKKKKNNSTDQIEKNLNLIEEIIQDGDNEI